MRKRFEVMCVEMRKEVEVYVSNDDIIRHIDDISALELLRPLVNKIKLEYDADSRSHSEYYKQAVSGKLTGADTRGCMIMQYQKICKNSSSRVVHTCSRILSELDMLSKHANRYHQERGAKEKIKI